MSGALGNALAARLRVDSDMIKTALSRSPTAHHVTTDVARLNQTKAPRVRQCSQPHDTDARLTLRTDSKTG